MLQVTNAATSVLRDILSAVKAPADAGLRISRGGDGDEREIRIQLQLQLQPAPSPEDEEIDANGVRIFVSRDLATLLNERTLDAEEPVAGEARLIVL
jgi:Fe-S cluster assembly iron-binding protein IscA